MGSSNIVDSGRFAGQKSNFNQTCSLLSQYFKEKGSLGDLNIGFNRNLELKETTSNTKTMNLLPMIEKAGQMPEPEPEPEKSQLTIFYAGQVLVFNDFPADKVEEIMLLAGKGIPLNSKTFTCNYVHNQAEESVTPAASVVPSFDVNMVQANPSQTTISTKISDLPIARKNSLTRFLEKRKDRITARAPYKTNDKGVAISKLADENKPWLGMAAAGGQFPLQMNRHT